MKINSLQTKAAGQHRNFSQPDASKRGLQSFVLRAEQIFIHPGHEYGWDEIVTGAVVATQDGGTRVIPAVGKNTFRAFWRHDKASEGPKAAFLDFFISGKPRFLPALCRVRSLEGMDALSTRLTNELRSALKNVQPGMLESYNKLRKPVDLYLEHLVAMAIELREVRSTIVPLLNVPLDSWTLNHPGVFSESELSALGLFRGLTFSEITTEQSYAALQQLARAKAKAVSVAINAPFHPIYYDLF